MAATTSEITLKLLIDTKTKKVVFAEAKKDFVDLLFGLLQVPVGSIMGNLLENGMDGAGSMARLYKSVIDLESSCLLTNVSRDLLLWPELSSSSRSINLPPMLQSFESSKWKSTETQTKHASYSAFGMAPSSPKSDGFVGGMMQYTVMDDLTVRPLSPISTITLLNTIGVKDFSSLVEKNVIINFKKGLEIVKASFVSDTVLSDVFVRNQAPKEET
ncbi:hypothetical protein ACOSP7_024855 [Xanthoceras sorbifolium]|uniref:Uncharacterized protein n=1 Tax=Xanthoceras sorbifolium TaxID=99658 RepID=A0ABQ8H7X8_9ROSI|nr:hypothetical protein JRO89_XS13G0123500 [Xanthoceras sorbifolium]